LEETTQTEISVSFLL